MANWMSLLGSSPPNLIICFLFLFLLQTHVHAQDLYITRCSDTANYTSNSQFQTNLNLLLRTLRSNGTRDRFVQTTVGAGNDTVYGLIQCRVDASIESCRTCVNNSTVEILQRCPNRKDAALRYHQCVIRYSNTRFYSQIDNAYQEGFTTAKVPDPNLFDQQLGRLLRNLSDTAKSRESRYDSGSIDYTPFRTIYGLTDCTRDLSSTDCLSCLRYLIGRIPSCCNSSEGAYIVTLTCSVRFEAYPIVEIQPPPPPPVGVSPPQSTTNNTINTPEGDGNTKGNSINVVVIVVPVIGSVFLLGFFAYFISCRIRRNKRKTKPEIIYNQDVIINQESLQFTLNMIRTATDDFSDANKLGQGGFGAVYKGEFLDGQEIAVKRLSKKLWTRFTRV